MTIQEQIEREKTKIAQEAQSILTLQERLDGRADLIRNIVRNYQKTWFKPDGTPLSDLELSIPDLRWEPGVWTGYGPLAKWSAIQEEDLGFNGDYSTPADKRRSEILTEAGHEKEKFNCEYHRRQLTKRSFERNLQSAVINLRKYLTTIKESDRALDKHDYEKYKPLLDDWEYQLIEHFDKTSYSCYLKSPYQARQITSAHLQHYLGEMEKRNSSESLIGGKE